MGEEFREGDELISDEWARLNDEKMQRKEEKREVVRQHQLPRKDSSTRGTGCRSSWWARDRVRSAWRWRESGSEDDSLRRQPCISLTAHASLSVHVIRGVSHALLGTVDAGDESEGFVELSAMQPRSRALTPMCPVRDGLTVHLHLIGCVWSFRVQTRLDPWLTAEIKTMPISCFAGTSDGGGLGGSCAASGKELKCFEERLIRVSGRVVD